MSSTKVEKVLTIPYDVKIPKIRIVTRLANQLKHHRFVIPALNNIIVYRIIVRIDAWDIHSQYPDGVLID